MKINLPKEVLEILNKFQQANYQIYIVGGAIRDLLLGKEVKDWDFTTDATPEEILKILPEGFYNNKFGTVGLVAKGVGEESSQNVPQTLIHRQVDTESRSGFEIPSRQDPEQQQIFEITTMRKEGNYRDHRHPVDVSWTNKIEEDLARRDFTINAMALGVKSDELRVQNERNEKFLTLNSEFYTQIDPFNGQADLNAKLIRAVGDPNQRFQEDALRLIRAIRFSSQLEFDIDGKTSQAIKANADLIKEIAFERIRDELFKILSSTNPYIGVIKLRETGILSIILPEVEACFGIIQEGPKHDRVYEIGDHLFRTMRETPSSDPLVKFAALLHDIGKGPTFKKDSEGNVTFYNHEIVGANMALELAKRFNLSKDQTDKLFRLIRWHMFSTNENQTDAAVRRFIKNVGVENLEDIFALRIGDRLGGDTSKPVSWRMEEFQKRIKEVMKKPFSITDLKVNGKDVMEVLKIKPGPKVGEVLNKLFQEVLEDASKNNREYLLDKIKQSV